ncbi:flavin-containing monooxygenase [Rhodococcus opacus]|nr:NAD(P)/FAD-dependent oxidoreductase [Rhodococcus opacus]
MMQSASETTRAMDGEVTPEVDVVLLGAGVGGLYQLHKLREQGLRVQVFDAAADVGGVWCWNRYPGARFDSEGKVYQYFFSEELYKEWSWTQRYPGQPEIERWAHWVADRLNLRQHIKFGTRITNAHYDEERGRWTIRTDRGDVVDSQFFVSAAGPLSAPMNNLFEGQDDFRGRLVHTSRWPREGVELAGKRVGVIGIGATGIQVIQTIASEVEHLTVFARGGQYTLPMKNTPYGPDENAADNARFEEYKNSIPKTFAGFHFDFLDTPWTELTPQQRLDVIENLYQDGSLKLWVGGFGEMFGDSEVNGAISDFVREKMRARLNNDPHLCETLIPADYGFGTHRVPLENGYLEVYLRENVELVGVKNNPIKRVVESGIELADGSVYELDVIIMATGFDAGTGSLSRIDIRGRDGRSLSTEWTTDIRTLLGMQIHGYPNLFASSAPLAPSAALCNMTTCLQQQAEWISDAIRYVREQGASVMEATREAQDAWVDHCDEVGSQALMSKTRSWYNGSNVPGKPSRLLAYVGGAGAYREKCDEEAAAGYPGFSIA